MKKEHSSALSYIGTVLEGLPHGHLVERKPIENLPNVPNWISHAAHFTEVHLASGYQFVLVEPRADMSADRLLSLYRLVQAIMPMPLILVTDQQRHQVRSALKRAHIGLVRSGQFLFAPQFGMHVKGSSARIASPMTHSMSTNEGNPPFQPQEVIFLTAAILHESLRHVVSLTRFMTEFIRIHSSVTGLVLSPEKLRGRVSSAMAQFQRRNLVIVHRAGVEVGIQFVAPGVLWNCLCRDFQSLVIRTHSVS